MKISKLAADEYDAIVGGKLRNTTRRRQKSDIHFLSGGITGKPLCGARSYENVTVSKAYVNCDKCKEGLKNVTGR